MSESESPADVTTELETELGLTEENWQRLSPRKLLIDPIGILRSALVPLVVALVGIGSQDLRLLWFTPLALVVVGGIGLVPYLTTFYRITGSQFQLRKGLLNKSTNTAPLDRIRSVDLESTLLHRALGVAKVQIGTGVDDERMVLDSLDRAEAEGLRRLLLVRRDAVLAGEQPAAATGSGTEPQPGSEHASEPAEEISRFDLSWSRYAPFSLSRMVVLLGALGVLWQFLSQVSLFSTDDVDSAWEWVNGFAVLAIIAVAIVGFVVVWVLVAVVGYITQWWDYRLVRENGSLHVSNGLFTTRAMSIEEKRVRGVRLAETVLMRLVGGADLATLSTGTQNGTAQVVPPCPSLVARRVGDRILEDHTPLSIPMATHGPRALRRSLLRGLWATWALALITALLFIGLPGDFGTWLDDHIDPLWVLGAMIAAAVVGLLAGWATYRHLGHAVTRRHLVAGSGILTRRRTVLETDGIIGWVVHESWFQRRFELATLVATTAAGDERVRIRDVDRSEALRVMWACTPTVLAPFAAE